MERALVVIPPLARPRAARAGIILTATGCFLS